MKKVAIILLIVGFILCGAGVGIRAIKFDASQTSDSNSTTAKESSTVDDAMQILVDTGNYIPTDLQFVEQQEDGKILFLSLKDSTEGMKIQVLVDVKKGTYEMFSAVSSENDA